MKQITVPLKPITVNQCWQGRRFKTKAYSKWRNDFSLFIKDKKPITGKLSVILEFYILHESTTDTDNLIKPTLDALKESGVITDDKYICEIHAYKYKSRREFIRVTITQL